MRNGAAQTVVADASLIPTGTPLRLDATVGDLGQALRGRGVRRDQGDTLIQWLVIVALVLAVVIALTYLVDVDFAAGNRQARPE